MTTDRKPLAEHLTLYVPGLTAGKRYRPAGSVVVVWVTFVPTGTSVTVAPGTIAPVGSVTVPPTAPVVADCANIIEGATKDRQQTTTATTTTRLLNIRLPPLGRAGPVNLAHLENR